jgi:effector-binding domain-containing protein
MKVALLPGGFKPPHLGHYNMAKYLADFADNVIVRIGSKEREGIGKELALEIFNYYKASDPDPRAQKLTISLAQAASPVKDVYDFVEKIAPEGSELILGIGEKDAKDGRYNSIPKFAKPRNIKAKIELVPPQAGGISGTRMREIIKNNNKEEFFKFIPEFLPKEIKEEIWTKLLDTTMPTDIDEMMGGTMNKQEMAKHMANMKKLRKVLSKINAQGDMVEIPRNLTKGLRRKLYEGRYDQETKLQSRFLINQFKANLGKYTEESTDGLIGKNTEYDLEYIFTPDNDLLALPFIVDGEADNDTMQVKIKYNPNRFPEAYNDLNAEIRDTVRHELEHIAQFNFSKGVNPGGSDKKSTQTWFEYFTLPFEIPAFVQGLYKNAKFKKISFNKAVENFLLNYLDVLTDEEEIAVTKTWTDYARKNLPAAQIDEKRDPKVGTGKKPKGSGRRLYTDENPSDTVKVKFSTRQDIVDTLSKKSFKSKSHARQSQIINLIHQRVRAALNRAKDPAVKKRLRPAFEYIKKRKEASKRKTQRLKKEGMYPPYKANQVQQTRYKASDTFTRDPKKSKKLGYLEDNIGEGDTYEKMAAKGKKAGNLKQGTVRKRLRIPKGEKIPLSLINKEISRLKKMEKRSPKNQKYYKALTLAKTLKTTTNVNEMKLFSKEWWSDVIIEEILREGGAAGHMAHPFDLPNVNSGRDLIKSFKQAADSLKKAPGSVKIDGVNASIRLINLGDKKEFAMDRGSKKALDLKGVTKADLEDRFGPGHGMIKSGGDVLDIFNDALPSIQEELNALGLLNDPNVMFNMEYVSGKSNVQDYGKNFLAIHGLLTIESKKVQGARKILTKRITTEKSFAQADMDELLKKLEPFAKKKGFEIYGSVPTTFTKEPDFNKALNTRYTVDFAEGDQTKTLGQWLSTVTNIPKTDRLKLNIEGIPHGGTKDVGALSKQVYFAIFGGENVDDLFDSEQDKQKALQGAITYLATEKLGDAILDVLDSPMGSVNDHEGVVIRDDKISPKPFKVTGKFITGGVSSDFQKK